MNRLKKTLALALILALAAFMVPLTAAASGFTDDADINYKEQVEVLTGIGATEGFPGGEFRPGGDVTRAQAAAIIARLLLTRAVADSLPEEPTGFSDVPANHWAAIYIRYCVSEGIVVGYGNGRFGPNNRVTGAQFAIMLMRALKIGDPSRWEGAYWKQNAVLDGREFGILTTGADYTRPATREETCVYAFNGLLYGDNPDSTLAARVYPTLEKNDKGFSDLGRPAAVWVFGDPAKTISATEASPVAILNGNITQDDLHLATGMGATKAEAIKATVNSEAKQNTSVTLTAFRNTASTSNADVYSPAVVPQSVNGAGSNGLGVITEIYKVGSGENAADFLAVVIRPDFAAVTDVTGTAETSGSGAFTTYTIGGLSGKVFSTIVDALYDTNTAVVEGTVAKNDWVLYYQGADNLYIEAPGAITGVLSQVSSTGVYTIGSVTARLARAYKTVAGRSPQISAAAATFYADRFGNILGVKAPAVAELPGLAMVIRLNTATAVENNQVVNKYTADIVGLDGNVANVPIAEGRANGGDPGTYHWFDADRANRIGEVYLYESGDSGEYTFDSNLGGHLATSVDSIVHRSVTLTPESGVYNVNDATLFVVVNRTGTGANRVVNGKVTLYVGRNQVPTFRRLNKTTAVSLKLSDTAADSIAEIVYIFDDVFGTTSDTFVFVTGTYSDTVEGRAYDLIVRGHLASVNVPGSDTAGRAALEAAAGTLVLSVTRDSDGKIEVGDEVAKSNKSEYGDYAETSIINNGGILVADGDVKGGIGDEVPVYTITIPAGNPADSTAQVATALSLTKQVNLNGADIAFIVYTGADISAIYILIYTA